LTGATLRQLCRLRSYAGLGKPFGLPQERARSSCPAGLQRLSFDVIPPAFSRRLPPVAAHLDIGAASRKLSEVAVLSVYEEAGRARCRLLVDRRPVRALAT